MRESTPPGPNNSAQLPHAGPLSEARIIDCLKACQGIVVENSQTLFVEFLQALDVRLSEFGESAKTNQEQNQLFETQRHFRSNSEELQRYFCNYLGEGFIKFKNKELNTHTGEEKFQGDMLSLVENEDLEETIAISSITHRAETYYAEALWALNQRFSILNGGEKISERENPVGPVQFCESLRKALQLLTINAKAKIIAYKIFDKKCVAQLKDIFEQINGHLVKQGILPNLHYSASTVEPAPPPTIEEIEAQLPAAEQPSLQGEVRRPFAQSPQMTGGMVPAPDPSMPSEQYQGKLVDAIRMLQGHVAQFTSTETTATAFAPPAPGGMAGGLAAGVPTETPLRGGGVVSPGGAGGHHMPVYSNQQMVGALQSLQAQASSITQQLQEVDGEHIRPLQPQSITAISSQLTTQLQQECEEEGAVDTGDMHTIDLVGLLFEYMLSDDNLPDSVKALLSYLHTPFLKIAFIDTDFFQQTEHPARLLLNNLAEAGVRWVSNDGTFQYDIYPKIKAVVSRLLEEFKNDVRLFAELLLEFSSYTKKISRRQDLMERRAMEKVQGEEKLREVKMRVNEEVRSRTDGRELPSAALLLLLQPWSDYLAFTLLRYGDQSDSWQRALSAVDNILWSIQPKDKDEEKARQMDMHDELLTILETGFETIGYDQAKGKKLLEALLSLQKLALQSKKVEPAPAPMRDKLENLAAEKAGQTNEAEEKITPEEEKMVENLKMIEFGTWFEFEGGKRLKVAWYNSKTLHYMLVDQMGKKVAMRSGLKLAREMMAGKAKIIAGSTKPFFERALENIFHSLNARAESIPAAG